MSRIVTMAMGNMKRRDFLKFVTAAFVGKTFVASVWAASLPFETGKEDMDDHIRDYLFKMKHFDEPSASDIFLEQPLTCLMKSCVARLQRLQRTVGHGNFQLLSFDEGFEIAKNYSQVGPFTKPEVDFLERIFYENASVYGFYGKKTLTGFTSSIREKDVVKIPGTGTYVFNGESIHMYKQIERELGSQVILTSGVRGIPKQFLLFLTKACKCNGNLSLASRSLAPPGYSFHGVGDFDVGQVGFGAANFTEAFTYTQVCKRLRNLGYITFRYQVNNRLGVRFEPWHIKVADV